MCHLAVSVDGVCALCWRGSRLRSMTHQAVRRVRARTRAVPSASWNGPPPFAIAPLRPSAMPRRRNKKKEEEEEEEEDDTSHLVVPTKLSQPTSVCINPNDGDGDGSGSGASSSSSSASAAGSALYYIPDEIAPLLKSHQIAGIRFMWRAVAGSGTATAAAQRHRTAAGAAILAHFCGLVRHKGKGRSQQGRSAIRQIKEVTARPSNPSLFVHGCVCAHVCACVSVSAPPLRRARPCR